MFMGGGLEATEVWSNAGGEIAKGGFFSNLIVFSLIIIKYPSVRQSFQLSSSILAICIIATITILGNAAMYSLILTNARFRKQVGEGSVS